MPFARFKLFLMVQWVAISTGLQNLLYRRPPICSDTCRYSVVFVRSRAGPYTSIVVQTSPSGLDMSSQPRSDDLSLPIYLYWYDFTTCSGHSSLYYACYQVYLSAIPLDPFFKGVLDHLGISCLYPYSAASELTDNCLSQVRASILCPVPWLCSPLVSTLQQLHWFTWVLSPSFL